MGGKRIFSTLHATPVYKQIEMDNWNYKKMMFTSHHGCTEFYERLSLQRGHQTGLNARWTLHCQRSIGSLRLYTCITGRCLHLLKVCKTSFGPPTCGTGTTGESQSISETESASFTWTALTLLGHALSLVDLIYRGKQPTRSADNSTIQT